jgi:large subunit ribosomal protein L29
VKASELKEKAIDDLERTERELYDQLFKLRFQVATNQIENPGKVREVRKDLARVKTIINMKLQEQKSQASAAPSAGTQESK